MNIVWYTPCRTSSRGKATLRDGERKKKDQSLHSQEGVIFFVVFSPEGRFWGGGGWEGGGS